jgi:hypothetical protein
MRCPQGADGRHWSRRRILSMNAALQKGKVPGRSSRKELPQSGAEQNTTEGYVAEELCEIK